MKLLKKSKENKVIFGVLGGLGEYFDVDPIIIRLTYLLVTLFTGLWPGVIVYLVAALVVPASDDKLHEHHKVHHEKSEVKE